MKIIATTLLACTGSIASAQSYELVWSDEFDGNQLDTSSWEYMIGTGTSYGLPAGWGNNELQYYTNFTSNVEVSEGTLKINARQQSFGGRNYTSGRIRTMGMHDFLYGKFEARIKVPSTTGIWPAFWMLPTDSPYGGWASSGEIDIMESVNTANSMHGTIHYGANWPANQSNGGSFSNGLDFGDDFYVFAIEWEADQIRWYIDGVQFHSVNSNQWYSSAATGNPRAPFDSEFHLLLNVAVGGDWPGSPNGGSSFPQTMEVDYVRVYQSQQAPFGELPSPIPGLIEAEDFDLGTEGQSYHDCEAENRGGAYRDTGVDIQPSTEGGFNVGWLCTDEWMEYTVDVQEAGEYQLDTRVASLATGGSFRIESDGVDVTGDLQIPVTNGWQNWTQVTTTVDLEAGEQVLRFVNTSAAGQEYNLNSLEFTALGGPCSPADFAEGFGQLDFFDVSAYIGLYSDGDLSADLNDDSVLDFFDISQFLTIFAQGCP